MEVLIVFGSRSDTKKMEGAATILKELGITYQAQILSAHRVPEALAEAIRSFESTDGKVIIAGAGMAAHLPGVIASQTLLPVIGVPISASLSGLDALLSIVQMPKGIPVATVGIDNSTNAGMLAAQILALANPTLKANLESYRKANKQAFITDNNQEINL